MQEEKKEQKQEDVKEVKPQQAAPAAPAAAPAAAQAAAPEAAQAAAPAAQAEKKDAEKARKEKPANCAACNKSIKKKLHYYREGKFYCNKRCWKTTLKKEEKPQEPKS